MLEMGWGAYKKITAPGTAHSLAKLARSLHINRSPISQANWRPSKNIVHCLEQLGRDDKLLSIGFHLTGPVNDGIGRYGFSAPYKATAENETRACAFIFRMQEASRKAVWLENSNFYSTCSKDIWKAVNSANRISRLTGCKLIIDLAHLWIDCTNNRLPPTALLGAIEWQDVVELHLSGVKRGNDGTYHDSHGDLVHEGCWELLNQVISLGLIGEETWVNIEHSDRNWMGRGHQYTCDFERLAEIKKTTKKLDCSTASRNSEEYAVRFVERQVAQLYLNFPQVCECQGLDPKQVLRDWSNHLKKGRVMVSLQGDSMGDMWGFKEVFLADAFKAFFEERVNDGGNKLDRRIKR